MACAESIIILFREVLLLRSLSEIIIIKFVRDSMEGNSIIMR